MVNTGRHLYVPPEFDLELLNHTATSVPLLCPARLVVSLINTDDNYLSY